MEIDIERLSIRYLLHNPDAVRELVKAGINESFYFTPLSKSLSQIIFSYFKNYGQAVTRTALLTGVNAIGADTKEIVDFLDLPYTEDVTDTDIHWVIDQLILHKKQHIMKQGIQKIVEAIDDSNEAENRLMKVAQEVAKLKAQKDVTVDVNTEISDIIEYLKVPKKEKRILIGFREFDAVLGGLKPGWLVLFASRPKVGKCFAKGTKILMYDGTVKNVEDIKDGDLVMGDDSTPRIVSGVTKGKEQMYKIIPDRGEPFTVNGSHILALKKSSADYTKDKYMTITVNDYIKQQKHLKQWKLYRVAVNFPSQPLPEFLPPYLLGIWLGKEKTDDFKIILKDNKLCNTFLKKLNRNKHIPNCYKVNSWESRLELLAGIIDGSGQVYKEKNRYGYQINAVYKILKDDILFLARSLGFSAIARKKSKTTWDILIEGPIENIPVKILKREVQVKSKKYEDVLQTSFKIEPQGIGDYHGFTVDKNSLFLLADFTVVHNTRTLINIAVNMAARKINVLIFSLEVPREQYINLLLSCASGLPYQDIEDHKMSPEKYNILEVTKKQIQMYGKLTVVDTLGPVSPQYINAKIDELESQNHVKYDVVIVDHGSMMKATTKLERDDLTQGSIAEDLRAIARKKNCVMLTAVQRKQEAVKKKNPKDDITGSGEDIARSDIWFQTSDVVVIIHRPEDISEQLIKLQYKIISRYSDTAVFEMFKDFEITRLFSSSDNLIRKEEENI